MGQNETDLLGKVVEQSDSSIILFFVILAVILVIVLLPLYNMVLNDRKHRLQIEQEKEKMERESIEIRQDKYIEREREIIKVITANTEAMYGLKETLEKNGVTTTNSVVRIHERVDSISKDITEIKLEISRLSENQKDVEEMVKKIYLDMSGQAS